MKRTARITVLLLALALLLPLFAGCASDEPALTYGNTSVTEGEYGYYVSTFKGNFSRTYSDFDDSEEFYATMSGDTTTGDFLNEVVVRNTSISLICEDWFDELGLKLSDEIVKSVDTKITDMIRDLASGSKANFKKALATYGINRSTLRNIYLRDQKSNELFNYFYGSDGLTPITDEDRTAYLEANYVRIQQIYVNDKFTYNYDENGDLTYSMAGIVETNDLTEEELADRQAEIAEIEALFADGQTFDEVYAEYGDDQYPNGYYITHSNEFVPEVIVAAFGLEVGEWVKVESSIGVHYVKRLELEDRAWEKEENADFFQRYTSTVAGNAFMAILEEKIDDVIRNEELLAKHRLEDAVPNFNF